MKSISTAEALAMLAAAFDEPIERIKPTTARANITGWDSMGALSLMAELDERFGIELTADMSRSITSVGGVLDLLRSHGALRD
jgi:acyl carrier protein